MDEAEEEALFERLHMQLRRPPAAGAIPHGNSEAEVMRSLSRVEASLRSLAGGLDTLARRVDAVEGSLDPRIERAVGRTSAALRLDVDRLEARLATSSASGATEQGALAGARPFVLIILAAAALIAIGLAAARLGYLPRAQQLHSALLASRPSGTSTSGTSTHATPPNWGSSVHGADSRQPGAASRVSPGLDTQPPAPHPTPQGTAPIEPERAPADRASADRAPPANGGSEHVGLPALAPETGTASLTNSASRPEAKAGPDEAAPASPAVPPARPSPQRGSAPPNTQRASLSPGRPQIALQAIAPCWVVVRDQNGNTLLRRLMKPGETWNAPNDAGLRLTTWNPGALMLVVNGRPEALPRGNALRDTPLNELWSASR